MKTLKQLKLDCPGNWEDIGYPDCFYIYFYDNASLDRIRYSDGIFIFYGKNCRIQCSEKEVNNLIKKYTKLKNFL